jgi:hypothetical protein
MGLPEALECQFIIIVITDLEALIVDEQLINVAMRETYFIPRHFLSTRRLVTWQGNSLIEPRDRHRMLVQQITIGNSCLSVPKQLTQGEKKELQMYVNFMTGELRANYNEGEARL